MALKFTKVRTPSFIGEYEKRIINRLSLKSSKRIPTPEELTRYLQEYDIIRHLASIDGIIKVYDLEKYQNTLVVILADFGGESLKHWLAERSFTFELLKFAMDKTQQALIDSYLKDEIKVYQDWYQEFYAPEHDTDTVAFAPSFSLATFKKRFNQWFEKRREMLRSKVCEEWEYPKKKSAFESKEAMIVAISVDCLAVALSLPTTNVLTIGTILVVDGYLDKLCPESNNKD